MNATPENVAALLTASEELARQHEELLRLFGQPHGWGFFPVMETRTAVARVQGQPAPTWPAGHRVHHRPS